MTQDFSGDGDLVALFRAGLSDIATSGAVAALVETRPAVPGEVRNRYEVEVGSI